MAIKLRTGNKQRRKKQQEKKDGIEEDVGHDGDGSAVAATPSNFGSWIPTPRWHGRGQHLLW